VKKVVEQNVAKTPTSVKKQMSIMAFVKKKKDEALATRIMSGLSASPGKLFIEISTLAWFKNNLGGTHGGTESTPIVCGTTIGI
jgi:hypothetical protein